MWEHVHTGVASYATTPQWMPVKGSCGWFYLYSECSLYALGCSLWGTNWLPMFQVSMLGDWWYFVPQIAADYFDLLEHLN